MDGPATSVDRDDRQPARLGFEARVANPCIGADRADLVLAGCAILEAIRAVWPCERLRVADRGLREGILSELMADDGVWRAARPRSARPMTSSLTERGAGSSTRAETRVKTRAA